jgi:hypothetical protein
MNVDDPSDLRIDRDSLRRDPRLGSFAGKASAILGDLAPRAVRRLVACQKAYFRGAGCGFALEFYKGYD